MSHGKGLFVVYLLQVTARAAGWAPAEVRDAGLAAGEPLSAARPRQLRGSPGGEPAARSRPDQTGETGLARCGH